VESAHLAAFLPLRDFRLIPPNAQFSGGFELVEPAPLPSFTQQPPKLLRRDHRLLTDDLLANPVPQVQRMPVAHRRDATLESLLQSNPVFSGDTNHPVPCGLAVLTPNHRIESQADALAFYGRLRIANPALRCDFFEGVVMKRADSIYPVQLRSATEACRGG